MPNSTPGRKFNIARTPNGHLSLLCPEQSFTPFSIDFTAGKNDYRRQTFGKKQPLARAIGIKRDACPSVIDATAGLGTDAFLMAALGCHVTLIEQSDIVFQLLQDALDRAARNPDTADIAQRMTLHHGDARKLIPTLPQHDVIYLDPMFPETGKSAKVKKPLQLLQQLIGHQTETDLLPIARQHAKRVVLKRPRKLKDKPPADAQVIPTKTTQFWVFQSA